jgi:hypothetical protein
VGLQKEGTVVLTSTDLIDNAIGIVQGDIINVSELPPSHLNLTPDYYTGETEFVVAPKALSSATA